MWMSGPDPSPVSVPGAEEIAGGGSGFPRCWTAQAIMMGSVQLNEQAIPISWCDLVRLNIMLPALQAHTD
jgi:hypothetical protein